MYLNYTLKIFYMQDTIIDRNKWVNLQLSLQY